jgi:hypothetical protein
VPLAAAHRVFELEPRRAADPVPKAQHGPQVRSGAASEKGRCSDLVAVAVPSRSNKPRLIIASALMRRVRRGMPDFAASSSSVAGAPVKFSKTPISLAINRCFTAMKPIATKRLSETTGAKVGDGFEAGAVIGPAIDMEAVGKVKAHIAGALMKGAKVVTGGKRAAGQELLRADGADRCND